MLLLTALLIATSHAAPAPAQPHQVRGTERVIAQFGEAFGQRGTGGGRPYNGGGIRPEEPGYNIVVAADGTVYGTLWPPAQSFQFEGGEVFTVTPTATGYRQALPYWFRNLSDGSFPDSGISAERNGVLYGTTRVAGDPRSDCGVVYALTPSALGYSEKVLYAFRGGNDGCVPYGGVLVAANGDIFGTTSRGGELNGGTVYTLRKSSRGYSETILHSFGDSPDGKLPARYLVMDHAGILYGLTEAGGSLSQGVLYKLKPDGHGGYAETIVHSFIGGNLGDVPAGEPAVDADGVVYVATSWGASGTGEVYALKPGGAGYEKRVLYAFGSQPDAQWPSSRLLLDAHGNIYGGAAVGGAYGFGAIYELPRNRHGYSDSVIYSFRGGAGDGHGPYDITFDAHDGNLYGVALGGRFNGGVVFRVQL